MIVGYDHLFLGHPKYPVKDVIRLTPPGSALGCFAEIAGDAMPAIRRCLSSGRFVAFRVQLYWANDHSIVPMHILRELAPQYEELAKDYPHIKIYVSPSCEHSERRVSEVNKRFDVLSRLAPSCIRVNSTYNGIRPMSVLNEYHGHDTSPFVPYITSMDGVDYSQFNVERWLKRHQRAEIAFLWRTEFNMRDGSENTPGGPPLKPPALRTIVPTPKQIRQVVREVKGG